MRHLNKEEDHRINNSPWKTPRTLRSAKSSSCHISSSTLLFPLFSVCFYYSTVIKLLPNLHAA